MLLKRGRGRGYEIVYLLVDLFGPEFVRRTFNGYFRCNSLTTFTFSSVVGSSLPELQLVIFLNIRTPLPSIDSYFQDIYCEKEKHCGRVDHSVFQILCLRG